MAKFLNLGRMRLTADDTQGGTGDSNGSSGPVARPTGQRMPIPDFASHAPMASSQPFMPVTPLYPVDQPTPPTMPPSPTPEVPDPGITCPGGTVFDVVTGRCIPQYPTPNTPTQQPGAPSAQPMTEPPPGYFLLLGRPYPMWTLYLATGTLGFGLLLLAFLAGKRRKRLSAG